MALIFKEQTAPATPTTGYQSMFIDTADGIIKLKDDAGVVTNVSNPSSITSIGLSDGSSTPIYTVSGSPLVANGMLTFSLATQAMNKVFAGPSSGADAQPTFRTLVANDIPALSYESTLTFSTGLTRSVNTITVNTSQNIATLSNLTSNGYVKTSGGVGTLGIQAVPIPVADGGSGTTTAFTLGSIIFAGASGVYTQDNANFFIDNTNKRLGIGTATPGYREHIVMAAAGATDSITWEGSGAGASRKWNWMPDSSGFLYMKNLNESYYSMVFDNTGRVGFGIASPIAQLHVVPRQASFVVSVFKGFASQTADLTQWQNSSAVVLAKMDKDGNLDCSFGINTQTGTTYTLVLTDRTKTVEMNNVAANVITIPTNAAVAFPVGAVIHVCQYGAGATTITGDTGVTLNGASGGSKVLSAQYQIVRLYKRATDEWVAY